jgi:subtilisin family serine protease
VQWNGFGPARWKRAWTVVCSGALLTFAAGAGAVQPTSGTSGFRVVPLSAPSSGAVPRLSHHAPSAGGPQTFAGKNPDIEVDASLVRQLSNGNRRDFAIEFEARPDLSAAYRMDWAARGRYVLQRLRQTAERSQAEVVDYLRTQHVRFDQFFVKNVILVHEGDYPTLQGLLRFDGIAKVRVPPRMGLIVPDDVAQGRSKSEPATPRAQRKSVGGNLEWVQADAVWRRGITGAGTVVGSIDSGVRFDHEALVRQYRGNLGGGVFDHNFNWFDPELHSAFPAPASAAAGDQHGTHTMGTMVGDDHDPVEANRDRVGMAPDAKWIACQGFPAGRNNDNALMGCGQFMLAPTDLDGRNANADLRPMVLNNSWGACTGGEVNDFYADVVDSWNAAGIVPVFAAGNASNCQLREPPGLSTVGSPGSYPTVFTVGSTGNTGGQYAPHSTWGPTEGINRGLPDFPDTGGYPQLKPNVVSPGVEIRSTVGDATDSYASIGWTGTSMSTPHVTGLVALMFQAAPCLVGQFGTVGTIIQQTARPIDYDSGGVPGVLGPGPGNIPNFATGWGEIDAPRAVDAAAEECGVQAFIAGRVTVQGSSTPIAGALVELFVDENVRVFSTTTDADGRYNRRVLVPEQGQSFTVRVSLYGYHAASATHVTVVENQTTTQNLELAVAEQFTVGGKVTDASTGWPLHARIAIDGYPPGAVWSDPLTGEYSVDLVEGIPYAFATRSSAVGYGADARTVGPLTANATVDIALQADLDSCTAPGYHGAELFVQDFESGSPPAGWSIEGRGSDANSGWLFGADLADPAFNIPGHTRYAAVNDSRCGGDAACDGSQDAMISPALDLRGVSHPLLQFDSFFTGDFGHSAAVQASIDGGATWTALGIPTVTTGDRGWITDHLSLASVAGEADVRLRFVADDHGNLASGWAIDAVTAIGNCIPPNAGGLLVGRVLDGNTGEGLDGASVAVAGGSSTLSASDSDPALGAGYYELFALPGNHTVTADPGALPAGYQSDSASVMVTDGQVTRQDFALQAGRLSFTPAEGPAAQLPFGTTQLMQFNVANLGSLPANYSILNQALGEDFEDGIPPTGWTSELADDTTDCPWLTNLDYRLPNFAGGEGLSATVNSDACGIGAVVDARLVSPVLDLSNASKVALQFMLSYKHTNASRFDVEVSSDGGRHWTSVFMRDGNDSATGPGTPVSLDLASLAGAFTARIRLRYQAGWDWYVQIDQLRLYSDTSTVPWLGLTHIDGALGAAPAAQDHPVLFRADRVEQPGVYASNLKLVDDTPYPTPALQATMTATTPPSFGTLRGRVSSLGYCDANPTALPGATVAIQGTSSLQRTTVGADGTFAWQADSAQAPFTVTVSAPGHLSAAAAGIALTPGGNADADLALRAALPCFDVVEDLLAAAVRENATASDTLNLANTGAVALDPWQIRVGGDPGVVADVTLTQSLSHRIAEANSVACGAGNATVANSFLRVYRPSSEGFLGEVTIRNLQFGAETAVSHDGSRRQPVTVAVYALNGPLEELDVTLLGEQAFDVPDGDLANFTVALDLPIAVPAEQTLLIELFAPDTGNLFFPATNADGETAPSYLYAPDCGLTAITPFADIGFPNAHLILDVGVSGAQVCGSQTRAVDWLAVPRADGAIPPGAGQRVEVDFSAVGKTEGRYGGALCIDAADPVASSTILPVTMTVAAQVPEADLSVAALGPADPVQAGTRMSYAVNVANAGPASASEVALAIELDEGMIYNGYTGTHWACSRMSMSSLACSFLRDVDASGNTTPLQLDVTPLLAGIRHSAFTVSATQYDAQRGNNAVEVETGVTPGERVDLALNASLDPASVSQGTPVHLRLLGANVGVDEANGVQIAVALPQGVDYASTSSGHWRCTAGQRDVVCVLDQPLGTGFAPTLDLLLATPEPAGRVAIQATIAASQTDGNAANNSATAELTVTAATPEVFGDGFEN